MASVYLTHEDINSGQPVKVLCSSVSVGGKKTVETKPEANGIVLAQAQTQGFDNFKYTINNVYITNEPNTLTWENIITLYKTLYDGTNYITLNIIYGSSQVLTGLSTSTNIKVIMETPNLSLDVSNSKNAYLPIGSLTFVETA